MHIPPLPQVSFEHQLELLRVKLFYEIDYNCAMLDMTLDIKIFLRSLIIKKPK